MKTKIKVGMYNIGWMGSGFQEHFGDVKCSPKKFKLESRILEKPMIDKDILSDWKPAEVTLDEFVYALEEKTGLLVNGYTNIFYIRDGKKELWAVYALWGVDDRRWDVFADPDLAPPPALIRIESL